LAPEGRRQLTFQSRGFFTSRHGNLGQRAPFFHFKLGKLTPFKPLMSAR
jgi:hypothetical protein